MNRRITRLVLSIILLVACQNLHAKVYKFATLTPEGSAALTNLREAADEIARRTQNRVKFKFYPGGVMGSDQAVLRKIRIGQLHGGLFPTGSLAKFYSDIGVYNLPFFFRDFAEVDYIREQMDSQMAKGLADGGMTTFGFIEGGFAYLMSKEAVETVADLRRKKVWIPDGDDASLAVLKAIDVSPIPLGLSDVLASLQTGLVDAVATSPIGAIALQWHTQVSYMTDLPLLYIFATIAIDSDVFNKMDPADQAIVREEMSKVTRRIDEQNRDDNVQAFKALEKQGIILVKPQGAALEEWRSIADTAVEVLVGNQSLSQQIVDEMIGHLKTYRQHSTPATASQQ